MKTKIYILISILAASTTSFAQLRVISNGNIQVGNWEETQGSATSLGGGLSFGAVTSFINSTVAIRCSVPSVSAER